MSGKILIVPCSGIGKVHGLIGREAAYQAIDQLGQDKADTLCLALIVTGDAAALDSVRSNACITVDGCPKLCSLKNVQLVGGNIGRSVRVVDAFKGHKGVQPGSATELTDDGWTITSEIAKALIADAEELLAGSKEE